MKKIKIMYVIPSLNIGGSERKVVDLVKNIDKNQFEAIVCCVTSGGVLLKELDEYGIKTYIANKKSKFDVFVIRRISRILKKENVDIVHTFVSTGKLWGRLGAIFAKTKVIISTEESLFNPKETSLIIEKILSKYTNLIIANSYESKKSAQKYTHFKDNKYQIIYNGINTKYYLNTTINKKTKRDELGLNQNDKVITCVARFDKRKGHPFLVEGFSKICKEYDNMKLLLIGDGKEIENIKTLCLEYGIVDNVIFTGFRNDINELLKISDIFILPSLQEGFGNVIIEAMASGLITIASKVGGIPEIIKHQENGLLVSPSSSNGIYECIKYVINNDENVKIMIKNAYDTIAKFDIDNVIKQVEEVYIQLYNKEKL